MVEGVSEVGAPDVLVRLAPRNGGQPITTRSDASGNFSFSAVPTALYDLTTTKTGYAPGAFGQRLFNSNGRAINVTSDTPVSNLRVPIWKFAALSGRVISGSGEPLSGVVVQSFGQIIRSGKPAWIPARSVNTDSLGNYLLGGLFPGEYLVMARPSAAAVTPNAGTYPLVFYPRGDQRSMAEVLTLTTGEMRSAIDFQLRASAAYSISGRLTGLSGSGAESSTVRLVLANGSDALDVEVGVAAVRSDGAFSFAGVSPGRYAVEVYAAALGGADGGGFADAGASGSGIKIGRMALLQGPAGTAVVSVVDRPVGNVQVQVLPRFAIEGTVAASSTELPPLNRAVMFAFSEDGRIAVPVSFGAEGTFKVAGLTPGHYWLQFTTPPVGGWAVHQITLGGLNVTDRPIPLSDRDVAGVVIQLSNALSEVVGSVRRAVGSIDLDAMVLAFPRDRTKWTNYGTESPRLRAAKVAADGSFSIRGLPAGDYFVIAVKEEDSSNWRAATVLGRFAALANPIRVDSGRRLAIDLQTATVAGTGR